MKRFVSFLFLLLLTPSAFAHPLPNLRFDRTVHVRIGTSGVTVKYALELNDWTMAIDGNTLLKPTDLEGLKGQQSYAKKYAEKKAPILIDRFVSTFGGKEVRFRTEKIEIEPERDHVRVRYQFKADWPTDLGVKPKFTFEDQNFEDRSGQITLTIEKANDSVELLDVDEPVDLRGKSPLEYKPGDDKRSRNLAATVVFADKTKPEPTPASTSPVEVEMVGTPRTLWQDIRERGVKALFENDLGFGVVLLLCIVFGAAHAFTPGHGKTMVAAYLVGERGTILHAVVLGLVTTFAHTGSVIAFALVVRAFYGNEPPREAQSWLALAGGLIIAIVGFWLFVQRLLGRADHVHVIGGHHHHEHGEHTHEAAPEASTQFGWARVVLLGLGGGIIPCYDAVLIFFLAMNNGQFGSAIPMLLAFSTGLALVLVALGIGVVLANRAGGRRFADRRWFRLLPIFSALMLTVLGLWFVRDAWKDLEQAEQDCTVQVQR